MMKKKMAIAYVACIHLLLAVVLVESDFLSRAKKAFGPATGGQPEITEHFHRMLLYHSRMDGNVPDGAVVFIGDSLTQGLCVSAVIPLAVNYGIGSDTTAGVLERLATYRSVRRASAVVVAVGVNDMKFRSNEGILRNYAAIAARIPENVPVVFSALLPLNETKRGKLKSGYPDRIRALNAGLEAFCNRSKRLFFLDVGPVLADGAGDLASEFDDGDGVHLNAKGNAIWIAGLRDKITEARETAVFGR
jgi:lysophospholipase L1-like esterase